MAVMGRGALLLLVALWAAMAQLSHQHAYLLYPESRNYQAYTIPPPESRHYCPHCGQGGGTGRTPGMCGDPFQDVVGNSAFVPFTQRFYRHTTLTMGQTFTARISVSTNHGGRMSLSICPLARGQVTQDCFNQPQYQLRRVNSDPKYNNKRFWYLNNANSVSAEETFRLPAGISCDQGCMIQWWWVGYQNCALPCQDTNTDDVPGECGTNLVNLSVNRCSSVLQTEQYYNCGDIIISSSGGGGGGGSTPSITASPPPRASSPPPAAARSPPPAVVRSPPPRASPPPQQGGTSGQCAAASSDADVVRGCQDCVTRGLPAWACVQQCAQVASSGAQMTGCIACLATPGVNTWGCQNCLQMAKGDAAKSAQCLTCVMAGRDPWTCGQCLNKSAYAACYTCLGTAGTNTWPCIA